MPKIKERISHLILPAAALGVFTIAISPVFRHAFNEQSTKIPDAPYTAETNEGERAIIVPKVIYNGRAPWQMETRITGYGRNSFYLNADGSTSYRDKFAEILGEGTRYLESRNCELLKPVTIASRVSYEGYFATETFPRSMIVDVVPNTCDSELTDYLHTN